MDRLRLEWWIEVFHTEKEDRILGWGNSVLTRAQRLMSLIHPLNKVGRVWRFIGSRRWRWKAAKDESIGSLRCNSKKFRDYSAGYRELWIIYKPGLAAEVGDTTVTWKFICVLESILGEHGRKWICGGGGRQWDPRTVQGKVESAWMRAMSVWVQRKWGVPRIL